MPLSRLFSAAFVGLEALLVEIETDISNQSTPSMRIVGLPDAAIKEAKDRVVHAIKNNGFSTETLSCTVHLAPADVKKAGAFYDLPIALGILQGLGAFKFSALDNYLIAGELGLSGEIRSISGTLALCLLAKKLGKQGVLIPMANVYEAGLIDGLQIVPFAHLKEAITFFRTGAIPSFPEKKFTFKPQHGKVDMAMIKGHAHAKRALEIAAAGKHNLLMSGPPGTGKTTLAKAFISILPPLDLEEALEATNIYSLAGQCGKIIESRPFRSPHHTISFAGMIGGGAHPKPGEIALAHKGVLFLDEFPEFARNVLEALRGPLEDKEVTVSRANGKATFPADLICIAAMNPCPCGYLGHPEKPCRDSRLQVERYRRKISGPLLDRMDIHLDVPPISYLEISSEKPEESSERVRERVIAARAHLAKQKPSTLNNACQSLMQQAVESIGISTRAYHRILKVARTIASLAGKEAIDEDHLAEAISYRSMLSI